MGGGVLVSGLPSRYITLVNEARGETSVEIAYRDRLKGAVDARQRYALVTVKMTTTTIRISWRAAARIVK